MSWLIRQIAGAAEKDADGFASIIGTSGKVIQTGLTDKQASDLKQALIYRHPDNIYSIEQEQ